jgi:hypothetical protein
MSDLDGVKQMKDVEVLTNKIHFKTKIFEVEYAIVAGDGSVMRKEKFTVDMSAEPGLADYKLSQMATWAKAAAIKHAKAKYKS